jgi:DNA-binding transcriptional ArsR family regulator
MSTGKVARADRDSRRAPIFAALGDETRLAIVTRLAVGQPHSISQLAKGTNLTRQAVTKHLVVLQNVGLVRSLKSGRENLFEFEPEPLVDVREYLDFVSQQWDEALFRLKALIENESVAEE